MIIKNGIVTDGYDEHVREIVVPDGVIGIGRNGFAGCCELRSITLPNSLRFIGEQAFCQCTNLKSVLIPYGVTHIGEYAFGKCSSLQHVSIPDSVTVIDEGAFCKCDSLETLTIPASVKKLCRTVVLSCLRLRHLYYGDLVADATDRYWLDNIDLDSEAAIEMLRTKQYGMEIPDYIKYPTILAYRKKHPDPQLLDYIRMNAAQIISYLMMQDDLDEIHAVLQIENVIRNQYVMKHILELAIEQTQKGGSPEIQMILMRYANTHFPAESRRFFL